MFITFTLRTPYLKWGRSVFMQYSLFPEFKYRFFSFGSGSSGNCYYLGTEEYGILIDAGIGLRTIKKTLREYGIGMERIVAVLITHDHADHIKAVGAFGDKQNIPVYTTGAIHDGILRNRVVQADLHTTRRIIEKEKEFVIKDFKITAFDVPHDSIENVGYHIEFDREVFVLATDVGQINKTIINYTSKANHLVIEANYDEHMLMTGKYPHYLKARISNGTGHLSNRLSAELIGKIYNKHMKNIWLCHLSQDNNHPELAYKTIAETLEEKGAKIGVNIKLHTLSRYKASGLVYF